MDTKIRKRSVIARYGLALGAVVVGWLAREALTPLVGPTALPFISFFPAVAAAAWYGGLGPGVMAALLGAVAANWFFIEPLHTFGLGSRYAMAALAGFAVSCSFIVGAIEAMHRAVGRASALERARNQQQNLLATTVASIGDAVIVTNGEGRVTFLNAEAERLTGWKTAEANGQPLPSVFHIVNEMTRQPSENPVAQVFRTGKVTGLANHTLLLGKQGTETPIDDSAAPIREADGPIFGVVLVFRDVTAQRKAEQASARLAAIVEHSGDVIFTKSLDGVIQTWNSSAERLFRYQADEIIGKPVTLLFPPERLNEEDYILSRLREGKPVERLETIRVAKDGRKIPVAVSVSPLKNAEGQIIGASKIIHDITELVEARAALTREKELLATTLASIGDAVIITDEQGRVTFLNAEAERLTKWKTAEASGHPLPQVFRIVNEETRARVEDPVEKVLRLGNVVGLANHTVLIAKDGTEMPIDDSAAPIRQPGGALFGVVLVFRDFTQRRAAEAALHEAHKQLADRAVDLEKLVEERTARLREMVAELEHVSYAIVHDMRAPLRAMQTFAGLLETQSTEESPNERIEYARRIMVAARRLDRLIQDALDYNKAVLAQTPMEPVDLTPLVRGLIETYPNLDPSLADIRIKGQLPVVQGNEALLTQCFSNLLGNAVKFVPQGKRPRIDIWSEVGEGIARIWVEDNGIGIGKPAQKRLFGLFERLAEGYEGTGIGLAIVRKVVERMGGKVGAESELGQGSRFWVELPVARSS